MYGRHSYYHWDSPAKITPVPDHQGYLILIVIQDSRYLYPEDDVTKGLGIKSPMIG